MNQQKENWDRIYEESTHAELKYDLWLDKYKDILEKSMDTPIVDLGCGFGNDTLYLKEKGYEVISCDFSEQALIRLISHIEDLNTICFDMADGLPFEDNSTKVIISDLSLHYFSWEKTKEIVKEIGRALTNEGTLLCRVNSVKDTNYGAGQGTELEKNFYNIDGELKRFFDEASLRELFKGWDILFMQETEMDRYKMKKIVWEIAIEKI